jgi:hypothetical protein
VTTRARWWILLAATYSIGCLMHLRFSLWLVRLRETPFGSFALADLVPALSIVAAFAVAAAIARQLGRSPRPWRMAGFWLAWIAAVVAVDLALTFSANEWAHYPQYALIAWLLARALDPERNRWCVGRVLFWVTLMGAGDELLQYLWITASYSDYFDFNDCLVNLLGASAGLLFYYGAAAGPSPGTRRRFPLGEVLAIAILALAVKASFQAGLVAVSPAAQVAVPPGGVVRGVDGTGTLYLQRSPRHYGSWQGGNRWAEYYVLPPVAGLGLMLVAGMVFAGVGLPGWTPAPGKGGGK